MRKISLFISLILLFGCEKYVGTESNPQLNINGRWKISSIVPTYESTVFSSIEVTNSEFFAVSPLKVISYDSNKILVTNDTSRLKPCFFYKRGYVWEFQYNTLTLKNDIGKILAEYNVWFKNNYYSPNDFYLEDKNTGEIIPGNFHFKQNGNGANPANELTITVPDISYDVNICDRKYSRAITQHLFVNLGR